MDALLDPAFHWDGTHSDLAQQYYRAHRNLSASNSLATVAPLPFRTDELPDAVQRRLAAVGLGFNDLPSLLQRALLWDAGLVFGNNGRDLLQVYTSSDRPMAQLAVSLESFRRAGCSALNCSSELRSQYCNGTQMLSAVKCMTDDLFGAPTNLAMWATGSGRTPGTSGDSVVIPEMRLLRHQWVDGPNATQYLIYAIHTVLERYQPAWSQCPALGRQSTGLAVPCGVYTAQDNQTKWQHPPPSAFVSKWLELRKQELAHSSKLDTAYIVLAVCCGVVGLVILMAVGWWYRRRRQRAMHEAMMTTDATMLATESLQKDGGDVHTFHSTATPTLAAQRSPARYSDDATHAALRPLLEDPHLIGKRLDMDAIVLERQVAQGAFGEVWRANHNGLHVAVKRVRQDKKLKYKDLEDFTAEIRLTASLDHANLVQFVGVAWRSLDSLCMVTEYMANGDLQAYLETHADTLASFWTAEKTAIALGIARALAYLHQRSPPLIHRDVKAKNVLLDEDLSPRLMDFGVSKLRQLDRTMTSGIGTPFWTAPEIVEGVRYNESSDMYSFGVLLTELETCKLPYHDHQSRQDLQVVTPTTTSDGDASGSTHSGDTPLPSSLRPFLILNLVMSGSLRPSVSPSCPEWLRELVTACFHGDPTHRPTAQHAVEILSRQWSMLE